MTLPVLAHGGAAGAAVEVAFLLLPVALFAFFSWRSSRRQRSPTDADGQADDEREEAE